MRQRGPPGHWKQARRGKVVDAKGEVVFILTKVAQGGTELIAELALCALAFTHRYAGKTMTKGRETYAHQIKQFRSRFGGWRVGNEWGARAGEKCSNVVNTLYYWLSDNERVRRPERSG